MSNLFESTAKLFLRHILIFSFSLLLFSPIYSTRLLHPDDQFRSLRILPVPSLKFATFGILLQLDSPALRRGRHFKSSELGGY